MTANPRKLLLAAALLLMATPVARGQDRAVVLSLGTPSRLMLARVFETVIVGDPGIVDVRTDDDRSVVIEPLKPGTTNLVFVDADGRVVANVRVSVCDPSGPDACDAIAGRT
jgi:Flp pilus assembly secretin CpaC